MRRDSWFFIGGGAPNPRAVSYGESESSLGVSNSLQHHGLHSPWNSPGQNTGVGSLSLLQGIFPTQESNPGLLHCRQILYQLNHKGSPRILDWVVYPFSSRSSWLRNWTWVPTPVLLPRKSHGRRSLVFRGRKESDTTERLHIHVLLHCGQILYQLSY